ncbi:hypothetical protein [Actinoplanes couchii]|uniref:hypothetical protein n=1 Tax=Actinoplanes couchii TaxID=403638 RepID=UPI002859ADC7|nr:hypothetical protein [Actinoplanes couchii]
MRSSGKTRTRLLAAGAVVTALGGVIGFTQFANAADTPGASTKAATESGAGKVVGNNLTILTDTCIDSQLAPHDGFQKGERCVSTEFGEVGAAANNPTLLITDAPRNVTVGEAFQLRVSTRNLIRDRFLAAGQGGYYVESSVLQNGLVRGHFHTACRILDSDSAAPNPEPVPAFFVATEDSRGGAEPDTVVIQVPGLPEEGEFQCSSWAGDGSHRIPMMERANQTPALDSVRVTATAAGGGNNGGNNGGGNNNGGNNGGGNNNGGNGGNNGGGNNNGGNGGNNGGGNNNGGNGGNNNGNNGGGNNNGGNNGGNNPNTGEVTPSAPVVTLTPKTDVTTFTATPKASRTTAKADDEQAEAENTKKASPSASPKAPSTKSTETESETTTESAPKNTKKNTTAAEIDDPEPEATDTDGPALADDGAPDDPESTSGSENLAEPPATQNSSFNLISSNLVWIGGGAVLVLVGLIVAAFMRGRPRNNWR